ncbi:MAG: sugar transferase, partial [Candidatus Korobacteraceae bacterium]
MPKMQTARTNETIAAARRRNRELLPQEEFLDSLHREKRRSERSGHSFLLALVHLDERQPNGQHARSAKTIAHSVCSVIRETDTAGWYKNEKSFGVIFTELRPTLKRVAQTSIGQRLEQALCAALAGDVAEGIRITYHLFPEDGGDAGAGDPIFHRENTLGGRRLARILKRGMDVAGSMFALIVLAPLLLLITLAIKLTSRGPALFKQRRVGEGGRTFMFYKFRSMRHNSDHGLHREYITRMIEGQNVAQ